MRPGVWKSFFWDHDKHFLVQNKSFKLITNVYPSPVYFSLPFYLKLCMICCVPDCTTLVCPAAGVAAGAGETEPERRLGITASATEAAAEICQPVRCRPWPGDSRGLWASPTTPAVSS